MKFDDLPTSLGESVWEFPDKEQWPRHDVVGRGADLEPETLIYAYRHGVFPMVSTEDLETTTNLIWWSPQMRAIIPLDGLKSSRSMRRSARKFEIRVDTDFENVMRNCAAPHRDNGWITEEFIEAYVRLHHLGWAHSIEVIDENGFLAGGLYGVRIGGLFAGESMFHIVRDASKVALMALVQMMKSSGMSLLDVQWLTPHLASLGAISVRRDEYLRLVEIAVTE
ncbi:MAG: leucyl/phenylalanyl-tRNA--protein transferase [Actinomycetota bacterium]|nr:leucyl/phenylalanyl-tRNA--protein transferase [Actinomycetota bacterium]